MFSIPTLGDQGSGTSLRCSKHWSHFDVLAVACIEPCLEEGDDKQTAWEMAEIPVSSVQEQLCFLKCDTLQIWHAGLVDNTWHCRWWGREGCNNKHPIKG